MSDLLDGSIFLTIFIDIVAAIWWLVTYLPLGLFMRTTSWFWRKNTAPFFAALIGFVDFVIFPGLMMLDTVIQGPHYQRNTSKFAMLLLDYDAYFSPTCILISVGVSIFTGTLIGVFASRFYREDS